MKTRNKRYKDDMIIKDKREIPRYAYYKSTFYSTGNRLCEGVIRDKAGFKGVFIETDENHSLGDVVTIAIPPSGATKGKKLKGVIVRKLPSGFGVHFRSSLKE